MNQDYGRIRWQPTIALLAVIMIISVVMASGPAQEPEAASTYTPYYTALLDPRRTDPIPRLV